MVREQFSAESGCGCNRWRLRPFANTSDWWDPRTHALCAKAHFSCTFKLTGAGKSSAAAKPASESGRSSSSEAAAAAAAESGAGRLAVAWPQVRRFQMSRIVLGLTCHAASIIRLSSTFSPSKR